MMPRMRLVCLPSSLSPARTAEFGAELACCGGKGASGAEAPTAGAAGSAAAASCAQTPAGGATASRGSKRQKRRIIRCVNQRGSSITVAQRKAAIHACGVRCRNCGCGFVFSRYGKKTSFHWMHFSALGDTAASSGRSSQRFTTVFDRRGGRGRVTRMKTS